MHVSNQPHSLLYSSVAPTPHPLPQLHGSSSSSSLQQSAPETCTTSIPIDAVQQSEVRYSPSQLPAQPFPSNGTQMPLAPAFLQNITASYPTPNDPNIALFQYPTPTHTPCSPPSWQMLLTQMNGLLQLQNIQRNIEVQKQNSSLHCPSAYDTSVVTPTGNHRHLSRVYPMMHQPGIPFMGYSGTALEDTFQSGSVQYKTDPLSTGISNFTHLSVDPTSHHASCKDGYCHHIEEHLKKVKNKRKRKSSAKQEEKIPKVSTTHAHTTVIQSMKECHSAICLHFQINNLTFIECQCTYWECGIWCFCMESAIEFASCAFHSCQ